MKKLEAVIGDIRYGSVLTINKDQKDNYNSCIIVYDGRIFKDVKAVELGSFLEMVPNIKKQLDNGYMFQVKYLYEEEKYQSRIIHLIREGGYKEHEKEEVINNFQIFSDNFLDGIISLDTMIAQTNDKNSRKEKVIA